LDDWAVQEQPPKIDLVKVEHECDPGSLMSVVTYGEAEQHNREIHENRKAWAKKPVLRRAYAEFYRAICENIDLLFRASKSS
jgi:hypothetical protein